MLKERESAYLSCADERTSPTTTKKDELKNEDKSSSSNTVDIFVSDLK